MWRALSWAFWIRSVAAGLTFRLVWLKKLHVCERNFGPLAQSEPGATKACAFPRNNNAGLCPKLFHKDMYMLTRSLKVNFKLWTQHSESAKVKSNPPHSCETQSQEIKLKHMRECFIATLQFNKECEWFRNERSLADISFNRSWDEGGHMFYGPILD